MIKLNSVTYHVTSEDYNYTTVTAGSGWQVKAKDVNYLSYARDNDKFITLEGNTYSFPKGMDIPEKIDYIQVIPGFGNPQRRQTLYPKTNSVDLYIVTFSWYG